MQRRELYRPTKKASKLAQKSLIDFLAAIPAGLCKAENPASSANNFRTIFEEEWPISASLEENSAGIADFLGSSLTKFS